jgi:hypothetical protein
LDGRAEARRSDLKPHTGFADHGRMKQGHYENLARPQTFCTVDNAAVQKTANAGAGGAAPREIRAPPE